MDSNIRPFILFIAIYCDGQQQSEGPRVDGIDHRRLGINSRLLDQAGERDRPRQGRQSARRNVPQRRPRPAAQVDQRVGPRARHHHVNATSIQMG